MRILAEAQRSEPRMATAGSTSTRKLLDGLMKLRPVVGKLEDVKVRPIIGYNRLRNGQIILLMHPTDSMSEFMSPTVVLIPEIGDDYRWLMDGRCEYVSKTDVHQCPGLDVIETFPEFSKPEELAATAATVVEVMQKPNVATLPEHPWAMPGRPIEEELAESEVMPASKVLLRDDRKITRPSRKEILAIINKVSDNNDEGNNDKMTEEDFVKLFSLATLYAMGRLRC
ncbi:MAG: hypothetical protein ACRDBG_23530 [Waterburya sp.]